MTDQTAPTEESRLEDLLSEPTPGVVETMRRLDGDVLVLGVSGKMGPTLARMAKRASDAAGVRRKVIGVARFTGGGEEPLRAHGVDTIRCDLLDEEAVARLPDVANVVFMPARKFGSTGDEATTWAVNSYLPGIVARKFRDSRIVAFSTGNVYALTPTNSHGPSEDDPPQPVGEYAMSCLGRERVFEYFSRSFGTRVAIVRLNYATDLRYGVLVDLARQVFAGEPIDLTMGHFNTIWQGDANAMALRAFERAASPPWILNVTGPEVLSVREVCERFGRRMGRPVRLTGSEAQTALLNNARRGLELFGPLRVSTDRLIEWVVDWVARGGRCLGKPTHFQARDGRF
ncbi:MAG TPA: NAD(P)-dependent oxidoreductase [Gemmataceae bacterium]|nr:NAD(P)-dependent oxidoreductase [Gemmataceae bacterium]